MLFSLQVNSSSLPKLGNGIRGVLSIKDEKVIGDVWRQQLYANGLIYPDILVNEYIEHLGRRLLASADAMDITPCFFAIQDSSINASAMLGSNIAIHSGLISLTQTESELAAVMAHELAHVNQQHILRSIAKGRQLLPITLAEALAAVVLGAPNLILPVLAGHSQQMINFTRQHEQEADRIGMQILEQAGFDPQGMPDIFLHMNTHARYQSKIPEYLLTHPVYNSRISDSRNRADLFKYKQHKNSSWYELIKMRIKIQASNNLTQTAVNLKDRLQSKHYTNKYVIQYGYALALLSSGRYAVAQQAINPLVQEYPENIIINMTAAEIAFRNQQLHKAQLILENMLLIYPDSSGLLLQYADLLLAMQKSTLARKILVSHIARYPQEPTAYKLLIKAEGLLDNPVGIHEAHAQWYVIHGDMPSALAQLDIALDYLAKATSDKNKQATLRIKARKNIIKRKLNEQKNV